MNIAQGAAATGASEETTPQEPQATSTKLRDAVIRGLEDLPADVIKQATGPKGAQGEPPEEIPAPIEEERLVEEPEEQPASPEPEPEPVAAEAQVPQDWPEDAKAQVFEDRRKRKERTRERDAWQQKATQLEQQLAQVTSQPTQDDPLRHVMNITQVEQIEQLAQQMIDIAEDNPDGVQDFRMGYDQQGNEIRRDFTAEEVKAARDKARAELRAAPARKRYLEQFWGANGQPGFVQQAAALYPEMFRDGSEENQAAAEVIRHFPNVLSRPDYLVWVGDLIAGTKQRMARQAKASSQRTGPDGKPLHPSAQAIISAPRIRPAPGVARRAAPAPFAGGGAGGSGGEIQQARENVIDSGGSDDTLEEYVRTKLAASPMVRGRGGRERTLA
jgi:hypothetical protein